MVEVLGIRKGVFFGLEGVVESEFVDSDMGVFPGFGVEAEDGREHDGPRAGVA